LLEQDQVPAIVQALLPTTRTQLFP
jgi:hypothetical protein